jgi:hypothetical protein
MLPRFSFRIPQCERGLEALSNYHTVRETSTGIARDEPCHDRSSHACDALRLIAESEAAHLLQVSGSIANRAVFPARPVEMSGELLRRPVRPLQILVPEGSFHQFIRR